jgi:hypothetical protein
MNAPTDFAHAAAVERILRAHGVASPHCGGVERSHLLGNGPLWGRGPSPGVGSQSLRATRPQSGGC